MLTRARRPPAGAGCLSGSIIGRRAADDGRRNSGWVQQEGPWPENRSSRGDGCGPAIPEPRGTAPVWSARSWVARMNYEGRGTARPACGGTLLRPARRDGPSPGAPLKPGPGSGIFATWRKRHPERRRRPAREPVPQQSADRGRRERPAAPRPGPPWASAERLEAEQEIAPTPEASAQVCALGRSTIGKGPPRALRDRVRPSLRVGDASPGPAGQGRAPACRWT